MTRIGRPLAMPTEDRKKEIYAAAEELFSERSYEKVTMSEIATAAGMSKKTLYVHFVDKEALLKSLVASSYIWPDKAFVAGPIDPVDGLKIRLKMIADNVLSERHIKLCRLAIGERIGIAGLADTFYEMGIRTSRQSLIAAVEQIAPSRRLVALSGDTLADMLFGAAVGDTLLNALLTGKIPDLGDIHAVIDEVVDALFVDEADS